MRGLLALAAVVLLAGCTDVATRIRYALLEQHSALESSGAAGATLALKPDHWPDGCRGDQGFRLVLTPYKGGRQVPVGDITVHCKGGGLYYTGMGSERIFVARELSVEKRRDEELRIVVRRVPAGMEIVALE